MIEEIIKHNEGKILEFKENSTSKDKILNTIIAFANTAGGRIIFGIEDKTKNIIGIQEPYNEEEKLANLIADNITPRLVPTIEILSWKEKHLLMVEVPLSNTRPHYLTHKIPENSTYVRIGSTNRLADDGLIKSLKRTIQVKSFDEELLYECTPEMLDFPKVRSTFSRFRDIEQNDLYTLGLIVKEGKRDIPTVGGVLLFSKEKEKFFPDAWIQAGRFKGLNKKEILDSQEIKQTGLVVDDAILFIRKHLTVNISITALHHQEIWSIPQVALREAIVNAIVHSDYEIKGAPIRISIFDDRIEIENPGLLPVGLTIDDIKSGLSKIRNRVLSRVFRELKLIEQWGSGIQRMIAACEEAGLKSPLFEEVNNRFRVTFFKERNSSNISIDQVEKYICELLKFYGPLRPHEIADMVNLTTKTVRGRLNKLIQKNMVLEISQSHTDPQKRYRAMLENNEVEWESLPPIKKIHELIIRISKAIEFLEENRNTSEILYNWRRHHLFMAINHLDGRPALLSSREALRLFYSSKIDTNYQGIYIDDFRKYLEETKKEVYKKLEEEQSESSQ